MDLTILSLKRCYRVFESPNMMYFYSNHYSKPIYGVMQITEIIEMAAIVCPLASILI